MVVKLASTKVNLAAEQQGEWQPSLAFPGVRYNLKSLNEPGYVAARAALLQRFARDRGRTPVPIDEGSIEFGRLYAIHLLLGWEGFDVTYSADVAMETLTNPEFREVVSDIENTAAQVGRRKLEYVEEVQKNSGPPSGTN